MNGTTASQMLQCMQLSPEPTDDFCNVIAAIDDNEVQLGELTLSL
jgi:hypothetical protein